MLAVNVKAEIIHTCLVRVGAEPGHPARFDSNFSPPKFSPPTGTEIVIEVRWKDAGGKLQSANAQQWVRNIKTKKALDTNWVFAGSVFVNDQETKKEYYAADAGDLICVLSSPYAMLDLPMFGYGAIEARTFEAFKEHIPPREHAGYAVVEADPLDQSRRQGHGGRGDARRCTEQTRRRRAESRRRRRAVAGTGRSRRILARLGRQRPNVLKKARRAKGFHQNRSATSENRSARVASRQLESKRYTTTLPGAPEGQYVVLQYKISFANNKSAVETVVLILGNDKKWRVSGYQIE